MADLPVETVWTISPMLNYLEEWMVTVPGVDQLLYARVADRQTDRRAGRQTDGQTDRQTDRQRLRQTDRQTQTDRDRPRDRQLECDERINRP